jgi:hypothetical protein
VSRAQDRFDLQMRQVVRAELVASGIPATHVDQVVDLGFHAAEQACAKLHEIVFSAGDERVSITAIGVAISIAQVRLQNLQEAMIAAAEEVDKPVRHLTVKGSQHG